MPAGFGPLTGALDADRSSTAIGTSSLFGGGVAQVAMVAGTTAETSP